MSDAIKVALRIRPLIQSEINNGSKIGLKVIEEIKQVQISDKAFTFDYVFPSHVTQNDFYEQSVKSLLPNLFKGYNVTILAYGQTGSGKTHSMGTAYNGQGEMGVIPRAVTDIFSHIADSFTQDISVNVTFVELYQEVLYDLLSSKSRDQCVLEVREDINKNIFIPGVTTVEVRNVEATLNCLREGSKGRATSTTKMNSQSSRSHAIFSINLTIVDRASSASKMARFYLVDLAGSERSKKTGAVGQTFKEGININKGLFALGKVISALGDDKGEKAYINYRESVLTRILKDSLGGNSITLMIACVSAADYNEDETISTLRYADKAKRIKNKPVINEDLNIGEIKALRSKVQQLQLELMARDGLTSSVEANGLRREVSELKTKLHTALTQNAGLLEHVIIMESTKDEMKSNFQALQKEYRALLNDLNNSIVENNREAVEGHVTQLKMFESRFLDVVNEQHKEEANTTDLLDIANGGEGENIPEEELQEQLEAHNDRQFAINEKLQYMAQMLSQKEELAKQIKLNPAYAITPNEIAENELKIAELEQEKAELQQQLKLVHTQGVNNNLAEQRRKRVQELESQLTELKKKVQEQGRLLKLKEQDELKIKKLNSEISNIKGDKVKLIKAMRQESDQFRKWKLNREREVIKLQRQDLQRANELARIKRQHNLQENVWKRKLEQAAANSKRLKDALALRKRVQETKTKGKAEHFDPWIRQELNVQAHLMLAKTTCESLTDDRAALEKQLSELDENQEDYSVLKQQLNEQLDLRSAQIQELQQKLIENTGDEKTHVRFDAIQTMGDAKHAIKSLFDHASNAMRADLEKERQLEALQLKVQNLEKQIKNMENQHYAENVTFVKEPDQHTPVSKVKRRKNLQFDDSAFDHDDNTEEDPDWRMTPLARRVTALRTFSPENEPEKEIQPSKRASDGGCGCLTGCKNRTCSCRKLGKECAFNCRCKHCVNGRPVLSEHNGNLLNIEENEYGTGKRPRYTDVFVVN